MKKKRVGEKSRGEEKGGKGKTNILSPPGTQLAARGCCLYIRTVDKAAARTKNDIDQHTVLSTQGGGETIKTHGRTERDLHRHTVMKLKPQQTETLVVISD